MTDTTPDELMREAERICNENEPSTLTLAKALHARDLRAAEIARQMPHYVHDDAGGRHKFAADIKREIRQAILTYEQKP